MKKLIMFIVALTCAVALFAQRVSTEQLCESSVLFKATVATMYATTREVPRVLEQDDNSILTSGYTDEKYYVSLVRGSDGSEICIEAVVLAEISLSDINKQVAKEFADIYNVLNLYFVGVRDAEAPKLTFWRNEFIR